MFLANTNDVCALFCLLHIWWDYTVLAHARTLFGQTSTYSFQRKSINAHSANARAQIHCKLIFTLFLLYNVKCDVHISNPLDILSVKDMKV